MALVCPKKFHFDMDIMRTKKRQAATPFAKPARSTQKA